MKEWMRWKWGGDGPLTDSGSDIEEEEEDDYFKMDNDESDDTDDIPEAMNAQIAMKKQIFSASDTYVVMENQERNQFKR